MPKNYYIILGIPSNSSQEDIKAAYRRLAKEFHPDHYGKNQSPFQKIQEAYSVLGNPKKRKSYDRSIRPPVRTNPPVHIQPATRYHEMEIEPLIPDGESISRTTTFLNRSFQSQWSMFDDIFDRFLGGFAEGYYPTMEPPRDLTVEITLSPSQAGHGGKVSLNLPVQINCPSCSSYRVPDFACWRCSGTGVLRGEKQVLVRYPAGIGDNHVIKIALSGFNEHHFYLNAIFKIR